MAWYDDLNAGKGITPGVRPGSIEELRAFNAANTQQKPQTSTKKKKDFWTDQISTGGGIGGALGGAGAGAAIGSIVPGLGTVIGGLIGGIAGGALGSGGGEFAENVITGEEDKFKNVGQEALLGGVFSAPPVRLARGLAAAGKTATTAGKAAGVGGKEAFEKAFIGSGKSSRGGLIQNMANKTYAQAFNLPRRFTGKLKPEETAQKLIKYGIGGGLDNIEQTSQKALSTLGGILDNSVTGIGGDVRVGDVTGVFKNLEKFNIPKGEIQALRNSVTDIGTTGRNLGYENPTSMLDKIRELEKRGYDLVKAGESNLVKNPNNVALGDAYLQAAQELEDNLYSAITSRGTIKALQTEANQKALNGIAKGLGDEFMAVKDPKELRTLMSPFVKAKQLTALTRDEAQAAGTQGMGNMANRGVGGGVGGLAGLTVGGPVGAALGAGAGFLAAPLVRGAQEAVQAPISTAVGRGLGKLAGAGSSTPASGVTGALRPTSQVVGAANKQYVRPSATYSAFGQNSQGTNLGSQPTLDEALLQQGSQFTQPDPSSFGSMSSQPVQQPQETSPYARENLLYDIQRDPANADQYIAYYQQLQEVFAPAIDEGSQLNATQAGRATSAQNALADIPMIQEAIAAGRIGGARAIPGAQTPIGRRLLGTEDLDAALFNIADNILRARTGAAAPAAEVQNFMESFLPGAYDSTEAQTAKLQRVIAELQGFMNPIASRTGTLEDALLQSQQGAY